ISRGTDADLLIVLLENCTLKLDVAGTVATIRPNQTCMTTVRGLPVTATFTMGTFTITGDGAAANFSGTAAIGTSLTCPFTGMASSKKGAATDAGAASE